MRTPTTQTSGPFADPARAAEIALMQDFGLEEFTELTGVGDSDYGIYRIRPTGVSLRVSEKLTGLPAGQQHVINRLAKRVALKFPCTPAAFMTWYDATRGKNGVSDFQLAKGFEKELKSHEDPSSYAGPSVPSGEIIAAFKVWPGETENAEWWDSRLRDPKRYGLSSARALRGRAQQPSRWYPVIVGAWLIDEKHLGRDTVLGAMQESFSGHDIDFL